MKAVKTTAPGLRELPANYPWNWPSWRSQWRGPSVPKGRELEPDGWIKLEFSRREGASPTKIMGTAWKEVGLYLRAVRINWWVLSQGRALSDLSSKKLPLACVWKERILERRSERRDARWSYSRSWGEWWPWWRGWCKEDNAERYPVWLWGRRQQ